MADPSKIFEAARRLRLGGLVAFPTETVYGLGADATAPVAVARIFSAKGRPHFNPLIAHVANIETARSEAVFTPEAERLAARFWPGPLTLVLPRAPQGRVCDLACAGLASVALRMPDHPLARALLEAVGRPVAAPSANRSGRISPTTAADVRADLGGVVDVLLDGGPCRIGLESTIIGCLESRVVLLRSGAIAATEVETVVGHPVEGAGAGIQAPGMLASHYAPNARVRLGATSLAEDEIGLDFGGRFGTALDLSPRRNLDEAAANLYAYMRRLDATGAALIAVAPIPNDGLGAAINDRLTRAAAPRA